MLQPVKRHHLTPSASVPQTLTLAGNKNSHASSSWARRQLEAHRRNSRGRTRSSWAKLVNPRGKEPQYIGARQALSQAGWNIPQYISYRCSPSIAACKFRSDSVLSEIQSATASETTLETTLETALSKIRSAAVSVTALTGTRAATVSVTLLSGIRSVTVR